MLVGIGHGYYWAGDGGPPPPVTFGFNETLCGGLKDGSKRGGFRHVAALLLVALLGVLR